MTTVVAQKTERGVIFASDGQVSGVHEVASLSEGKVFAKDRVLFGVAGGVRQLNLLKHALVVPKFRRRDRKNPVGYIINSLIPEIQRTLEKHNSLEKFDDSTASSGGNLIVAVGGAVGYVGHAFEFFGETDSNWVVGSGGEYAMGALLAGADPKEAVEIASDLDIYTGGHVTVTEVTW